MCSHVPNVGRKLEDETYAKRKKKRKAYKMTLSLSCLVTLRKRERKKMKDSVYYERGGKERKNLTSNTKIKLCSLVNSVPLVHNEVGAPVGGPSTVRSVSIL